MKTILVVEDDAQLREYLLTILEAESFFVLSAGDGRAGLKLARRRLPDLILCDVDLPGMDGHELLRALRAESHTAAIPLIFLTAQDAHDDQRIGMNLGADDYLTKPFRVADLTAAIAARLLRRQQRQATALRTLFTSPRPLEELGLTPREAEVLFWVAQSKTNPEIGLLLEMSTETVKKHLQHVYAKIGVENRAAALLCALETLGRPDGMKPAAQSVG